MALFGKKKAQATENDQTGSNANATNMQNTDAIQGAGASIKVLGSGCKKCNELEANAKAALVQLGMDTTIEHVTDFAQIAAYGVMSTPALMVDDKVVAYGKVLNTDEVKTILVKMRG